MKMKASIMKAEMYQWHVSINNENNDINEIISIEMIVMKAISSNVIYQKWEKCKWKKMKWNINGENNKAQKMAWHQ